MINDPKFDPVIVTIVPPCKGPSEGVTYKTHKKLREFINTNRVSRLLQKKFFKQVLLAEVKESRPVITAKKNQSIA